MNNKFNKSIFEGFEETTKSMMEIAGVNNSVSMLNKVYWLRLITAILMRLALVVSIFLFIYNVEYWYGVLIFLLLSLIFGGVEDRNSISR